MILPTPLPTLALEPHPPLGAPTPGTPAPPSAGLALAVEGPLLPTVRDSAGRLAGIDPDSPSRVVVTAIPGSRVEAGGERPLVGLSAPGPYQATILVTGALPAQVTVRTFAAGQQTGQATFFLIERADTRLSLTLDSNQPLARLRLRVDRVGLATRELAPDALVTGPTAADRAAPRTTVTIAPTGDGMLRITLTASDEPGGSGVALITYQVGEPELGWSLPPTYREPLLVPSRTPLSFSAIDHAGNREPLQRLTTP